ncbi:ribonuclease HII [Pseudoflavonifractor sp. MSJ-37]|uniref:ribonuclease HII n=1 Tax=Pseudoflavonifractor sp. MSJ-37 TaxID=2841531 RepID=UPI001C111544|nr:ribonuclease HII [Pseudoflavonifractor sp. MSJ-37]MBU5434827.1 ribonuclease HII [Pseudoflavonifractor sp. MSJ-37]
MTEQTDLWAIERALRAQGHVRICGCDEAGAGPLAGPVYAAAVILPDGLTIPGLDDSKKLTAKKRDALFDVIRSQALAWAVASVDAAEIDATDILSARMKAMQLAIDQLDPAPGFTLIDGNRDKGRSAAITTPHQTVVHGDGLSASIAAASILAKVSRDRWMIQAAETWPEYEFEKHKGYGTKRHYELLREHGPCPIHRRTFLKHL